jgi:hypothetical protein
MAMEHRAKKPKWSIADADEKFNINMLLYPANAFAHPIDVVRDPDLTLNEKRAILASWASDACAVEAAPDLRLNASGRLIRWDDIMDALRELDREDVFGKPLPHYKRVLAQKRGTRSSTTSRSRNGGNHGPMLN